MTNPAQRARVARAPLHNSNAIVSAASQAFGWLSAPVILVDVMVVDGHAAAHRVYTETIKPPNYIPPPDSLDALLPDVLLYAAWHAAQQWTVTGRISSRYVPPFHELPRNSTVNSKE